MRTVCQCAEIRVRPTYRQALIDRYRYRMSAEAAETLGGSLSINMLFLLVIVCVPPLYVLLCYNSNEDSDQT